MSLIGNGNFEHGSNGWRPVNGASSVTMSLVADGTAKSGNTFLRAKTTTASGSVAFDFTAGMNAFVTADDGSTLGGAATVQGVAAAVWVRAKPGGPQMSGTLTLWQLHAPGNGNHPDSKFTVGGDWTLITNVLDLVAEPNNAIPAVRIEFYMTTTNVFLDIDCVMVS